MSNQSTSKPIVMDDNNTIGSDQTTDFEWSPSIERCLLLNMVNLKPCGINKYLNMLILKERMSKELKIDIPIDAIWNYVSSKWDIRAADAIEKKSFNIEKKDFTLPTEYDQLIIEERERIKKLNRECLNDEINKKKNLSGKTRTKSNSMSSVDSKDGLNDKIPSTLSESSPAKTNEVGSDDGPCNRRSLHTIDKLENSKSDEKNKLKDSKRLYKKNSNHSKNLEKVEKISKHRGRKRKSRNMSKSSFSSDNGKQRRNYKNNLTDLTISDSSSRAVSPEISGGKTSNRFVTTETINREPNSNDNYQKLILEFQKKYLNEYGCQLTFSSPTVELERLKPEEEYAYLMREKSKNLINSKNEANNKVKAKKRNRVTSDKLVVQQSSGIQSLDRRSCSNKKL